MRRTPVRVGIIADVRVFREGLAKLLRALPSLEIALLGGPELLANYPDTVACDVLLIEARALLSDATASRVPAMPRLVIIGARTDDLEGVLRCAEAGALVFLHADATVEEIMNAIGRSSRHAPELAALDGLRGFNGDIFHAREACALTPREIEVIDLIVQRLSNRQIANRLGIELSTVKNHVHSILAKLRVRRRTEAAALSRDRYLTERTPGATTTTRSVCIIR